VAHGTHSMRSSEATHVTHRMHAMRAAEARPKARAVTDTSCASHLGSVASANVRGALAMNGRAILPMHRVSVLGVQFRLA
jgi:hypothetical protein